MTYMIGNNRDEMNPKVSIIVPCWNVEKYLDRCVKSLIGQTLQDIEIILVDDVSPDRTSKMCDEWKLRDRRIVVVHKKQNEGLGYARNTGLEYATGEYVMFLDSDDTFELDACDTMYETAKKYDADVVTGNFITETLPHIWNVSHEYGSDALLDSKDEIYNYSLDMIAGAPYDKRERLHAVSVCLLCIRKSVIDDNNLSFFSERETVSEDLLFKLDLLRHCTKMMCLDYPFYHYYFNEKSLTHSFNIKAFDNVKYLRTLMLKIVGDSEDSLQRVNRYTISDIRMYITRMVNSGQSHKLQILKTVLNDNIWQELKSYKPSYYYHLYPRIFYQLCLWDVPRLLFLYSFMTNKFRKIYKRVRSNL